MTTPTSFQRAPRGIDKPFCSTKVGRCFRLLGWSAYDSLFGTVGDPAEHSSGFPQVNSPVEPPPDTVNNVHADQFQLGRTRASGATVGDISTGGR
jgi:hypothetical protein